MPDAALRVTDLTCEHLTNPLGLDVTGPRLSWRLASDRHGTRQAACRIQAAGSRQQLEAGRADCWDSGCVATDRSTYVPYEGQPLRSRQRVWWRVTVWDDTGVVVTSEPAWFEMGLLEPGDWLGKWIAAVDGDCDSPGAHHSPLLRRGFGVDKPITAARAYICGLGYHELYINGQRVGDHRLDPGFTRFDRRALYVVHDVTEHLRQGDNAVGLMLGNGFYNDMIQAVWDFEKSPWRNTPRALAQIEVAFADGSRQVITTDGDWKTAPGPIVFNGIRSGEHYDARAEQPGWAAPGFDDRSWSNVVSVAAPTDRLTPQVCPPIRVTQTLRPASVTQPRPGVFVFDTGQNIAGWARLRASGPAGATLTLRYGEQLGDDGLVDQSGLANLHRDERPFQTDRFTLQGTGADEAFEPRFVYHGFRYVQVEGAPRELTASDFEACVAHSDFKPISKFACSNELLNRVHDITLRAYRGNFHSIPTDCPHREKNGWTGDAHIAVEQGLLNFDATANYAKWLRDFADEQLDDGRVAAIIPTSGWGYNWGNGPCWDAAWYEIAWAVYLYRGDLSLFVEHYDRIKKYLAYLKKRENSHGLIHWGLADWLSPFGDAEDYTAPRTLLTTAYYFRGLLLVSRVAALLGRDDESRLYAAEAQRIRGEINRRYFNPKTGLYANGSQLAQSTALYQGLPDAADVDRVFAGLVSEVERHARHPNTGCMGTKYLLNALTDNGRLDLAYAVATQRDYPSWGWMLDHGATTLWEAWDGRGSHNHVLFADISAWCIRSLAGLRPDPSAPGFHRFIVEPGLVGDLAWAEAEHESIYGRIAVSWKRQGDRLLLEVTVPANTQATVILPASDVSDVTESGKALSESEDVKLLGAQVGTLRMQVGGGSYCFACPFNVLMAN
jgi:alpha-L-rhamnosidase